MRAIDHANYAVRGDAPRPDCYVAISSFVLVALVGNAESRGNEVDHRRTTAVSTSWEPSSWVPTTFAPTGLASHSFGAGPSVFARLACAPYASVPFAAGCSPRIRVPDAVFAPRCCES